MQLNSLLFLYFFFILSLPFAEAQTEWVCSGQVVDQESQEPLVGANIYTEDFKFGTTTDEYGRYIIRVGSDYNRLIASYIGYQSDTCYRQDNCYFELKIQALTEVVVKGKKTEVQEEMGQFSPSMEQIKKLPSLLGDVDILKSLTLLPGVSGGVEGSSGILVRGGNLSHNLIVLDGTPVYNSNHLFGFMSSFNPDAIKHVKLYKGGFPAQYGGRLASVLNITMKDGNMRKRTSNLSVGLVNSSFVTEGPIWRDKISYMLAGRMFNLSTLWWLMSKATRAHYGYWVYDLNAKIKYKITKKQSLYLSVLRGQDNFGSKESKSEDKVKWGNKVAGLRYNNQVLNSLFLDMGVYYNRYAFKSGLKYSVVHTNQSSSASSIEDVSAKLNAKWVASPRFRVHIGGEYGLKRFAPVDFERVVTDLQGDTLGIEKAYEQLATHNTIFFMDNELDVTSWMKLKLGVRAFSYETDGFQFKDKDIRASSEWSFGQSSRIKLSYDEMNQPFHLLTTVGSSTPNEIWIPGVASIPPSKSRQLAIGYSMKIPRLKSLVSIEAYGKDMNNLVRYKPGQAYVFEKRDVWKEHVIGGGIGKAYGIELFLSRTEGRFKGWAGYTWSKSLRQYQQVNRGDWFPANYDRRHDLELTASYQISKKWDAAGTFIYQSGRPLTLPKGFYLVPSVPFGHYFNVVFDKINGSRTANYHRLDLSVTRRHLTKRGNEASWTFGVYNAYARNNPFYYNVSFADHEGVTPRIILSQKSILNIIPSINYHVKFGK